MRGGRSQKSKRRLRLRILPCLDDVAQAAHGADTDAGWLELRAQPRDVYFDRVRGQLVVPRGDGTRDALLAHDRIDVGKEELEQRMLALRQVEEPSGQGRALGIEIDHERTVLDAARAHRAAAARERGDSRDQ